MGKNWIQTWSGKKLVPLELEPGMVGGIDEIAHALAGKFRFTCQTEKRYSVAEHCVRGAARMPRAYAGAFLLHELSEVYLPDIASPLKPYVFVRSPDDDLSWISLEVNHTRVILEALGHSELEPLIYSKVVKKMDLAMLATEKRDLLGPEPEPWGLPEEPLPERIGGPWPGYLDPGPWSPERAERYFLSFYQELFGAPQP